jgi:hypothetical protein
MPLRGMRCSELSAQLRKCDLPHLCSSPDLSARSVSNWRTSAASRSGTGDEPTSANIVRKPFAKFSGSCIVRSSCTRIRMATGPSHTPPLLCLECDSRHFVQRCRQISAEREPIPLPESGNARRARPTQRPALHNDALVDPVKPRRASFANALSLGATSRQYHV